MWLSTVRRPITPAELQHAIAISTDFGSPQIHDLTDSAFFVDCCFGLVTIGNERSVIRLVHFSVNEYLRARKATLFTTADSILALQAIDPSVTSLVSDTNTKSHDQFKAYMAPGYSGKDVPSVEDDITEVITTFIKVLKRDHLSTATSTNPIDFTRLCTFFTIDSISKTSFGESMGYLESNSDLCSYIPTIRNTLPFASILSAVPFLTSLATFPPM